VACDAGMRGVVVVVGGIRRGGELFGSLASVFGLFVRCQSLLKTKNLKQLN